MFISSLVLRYILVQLLRIVGGVPSNSVQSINQSGTEARMQLVPMTPRNKVLPILIVAQLVVAQPVVT